MYTKKVFKLKDMLMWTRFETNLFIIYASILVSLYYYFDLDWLKIPWTPITLVGTAVAFVIGFQNNAAYDRIWEARKIWGGIVNASRTFGVFVKDMVTNEHAKETISKESLDQEIKTLTYRHIAWLTALRYAMRDKKPWETVMEEKANLKWAEMIKPQEYQTKQLDALLPYLSEQDLKYLESKNNKPTAILNLQSNHFKSLKEKGLVWEFSFIELENVLKELFTLQGQSERIKNFPYPRQFATLNHYFMWIFISLLPLAVIPEFSTIGKEIMENHSLMGKLFIWLSIPFYVVVAWVFHTMEKIGRTGENPFESTANDVPISTIARGIEIDLRQNLGEPKSEIPEQFPTVYDIQM